MGKDLNGKEIGKGICQRKDGRYYARIRRMGFNHINIYGWDLIELKEKLNDVKNKNPHFLYKIPKIIGQEEKTNLKEGGFVYFVSDGIYVKIGVAADVEKRIKSLQTGNSNKLTVLHSEYSKNPYRLEKRYHKMYEQYHITGEWFNILDKVI